MDLPYTLACIHWYKVHPNARFYFGLPIQVCLPSFETESVRAFMPVSRIDSVCVVASLRYDLKTPMVKRESLLLFHLMLNYMYKEHAVLYQTLIRNFKFLGFFKPKHVLTFKS